MTLASRITIAILLALVIYQAHVINEQRDTLTDLSQQTCTIDDDDGQVTPLLREF